MYAASGGHADIVEWLITKGSDVNLRHSHGGSALFEGATNGTVDVVRNLLQANANPFVVDEDEVSSLMTAASQGHTEVVELLLQQKLDVNDVAKSGGTALMFAAGGGFNATVDALLASGADVDVVVKGEEEYKTRVAQEVLQGKEGVESHKDGLTALMLAAQSGHEYVVKALLAKKASVQGYDEDGMSALTHAIKAKHYAVALLLVEAGANAQDSFIDDSASPKRAANLLVDAIQDASPELAVALVKRGADANFVDVAAGGVSVLTLAAYMGQASVVAILLEKDANLSHRNRDGTGPLMASAAEGHAEVVALLLEQKSMHPNDKDEDGTTALMAASIRGHAKVVKQLLKVRLYSLTKSLCHIILYFTAREYCSSSHFAI